MRWARKYLLEERLSDFSKKDEEFNEELKENIYNLLKDLPCVYEEYNEIMENETQTYQERRQAVDALKKEHSFAVALLKYATDLVSMKGRKYRKVDPRPGMEFYLRQRTKLVQRRLKGTRKQDNLKRLVHPGEISNSSLIMQETEEYANNSLQGTA
ncbi:hypothetical protein OESDEN_10516 [Oesophagostomum dentatum]|uniref:SXP/RAL-2 family protein Ani s 5-like cation-binding domain-containing protein n=1 Tax=Oesophagostomum dentatum TaxID=61180 RepID=A0A0B1SXI9_OESDE|nr:hypothetical protein OESDEN_10516 [Oesophagostomum dentatum]